MANKINSNIRMNGKIQKPLEALCDQAVTLEQPNKETVVAMLEAERIAHDLRVKRYSDVEEALQELKR